MAVVGQEGDETRSIPPGSIAIGDGWFLQARPRDRLNIQTRVDPEQGLPAIDKHITRNPCRLIRPLGADHEGRSPELVVRADGPPGLVEWAAVSLLTADGGLKRLVRGLFATDGPAGTVTVHLDSAVLPSAEPAFLVLQLVADAEGRIEGLRAETSERLVRPAEVPTADRPRASAFRALFDPDFYVAQAGEALGREAPFTHYRRTRGLAGFDPHPLFDTRWYLGRLPGPLARRESPLAHYWRTGDRLGLSPHPLFDPFWYRSQAPALAADQNALLHFLRNGAHDPRRPHPTFAPDLYTDQHPDILIRGTNPLVDHLSRNPLPVPPPSAAAAVSEAADARIIVYTCLFGEGEALKAVLTPDPTVRYIAFTDRPDLTSDIWEIVRMTDRLGDARRSSRLPKILAHLYLPDHDVSVYVDASFEVISTDIRAAVNEGLEGRDLGLYRHHRRRCVHEELELCTEAGIEPGETGAFYRALYESLGIGRQAGLFENGLIFRRNTAAVAALNELWWHHHRGARDQLSFMPAIVESGVRVNPIRHGEQVRRNVHFRHVRHERNPLPAPGRLYAFHVPDADFEAFVLSPRCRAIMASLEPNDCALFLQDGHGLAASDWPSRALSLAGEGADALVVGRSNTAPRSFQRLPDLVRSREPGRFRWLADAINEVERDWQVEVTALKPALGPLLLIPAPAWRTLGLGDPVQGRPTSRLPVRLALSLTACDVRHDAVNPPLTLATPDPSGRPPLTCIVHEAAGLTPRHYRDRLGSGFDLRFVDDGVGSGSGARPGPPVIDGEAEAIREGLVGSRRLICCTFGTAGDAEEVEPLVTALLAAGHVVTWLMAVAGGLPSGDRANPPREVLEPSDLEAAVRGLDATFSTDLILVAGVPTLPDSLRRTAEDLAIPIRFWPGRPGAETEDVPGPALGAILDALEEGRPAPRTRPRAGIGGLAGVLGRAGRS